MNEFIIQIDNISKNLPMARHNTAADKKLPEDLPQELWAADRVWVCGGGHAPPLSPLYDGPNAVLQRSLRHFRLQLGDREDNVSTSRLKPCTGGATIPKAAPPPRSRPCREQPAAAMPPKGVRFNLAPTPPPAAADPGTVVPGKPARFFARPGEESLSRYSQRNRGPPAWQQDYTFFAASRNQEAGGSSVGTLRRVAYTPLHITSPARDTQYCATSPEPFLSAVFSIHNVHMYTLNKISILLLLVLITSYCVGLFTN
jgi:hypothetical protein